MWRDIPQAERRFRAAACLLGVVAGLHGLVYVPFAGHRLGDTGSYVAAAKAMLHGGYTTRLGAVDITGLRIPRGAVGVPQYDTYRTPGYPLLLALTGGGGAGWPTDTIIAAQALLAGATTLLLTLLARRLWSTHTALLAGAMTALDPFPKHYVTRILSETLAGFLAVAVAYLFVRCRQGGSWRWWTALGLASAALTLTRPLFAVVLPLVLLAAALSPRDRLRRFGALAAGIAVLMIPWLGWTGTTAGRPVLTSFGEGWNLLLAAHGEGLHRTAEQVESDPSFRRDFDSVHRLAPSAQALRVDRNAQARYLRRADDEQRRLATDRYLHRLRVEPLAVGWEILYRSYFLWEAHEDWVQPGWLLPFLRALDWISLMLAAGGVVLAARAGGPARELGLFLVVFTFVNGIHHVEARYGVPARSLYVAFAALALVRASLSARSGIKTPATRIGGVT